MNDLQLDQKLQFAVLIDADNISSNYASTIFDELEKYGFATCRRIYGNWSKNNSWNREVLLDYSIMPVQQFDYTTGKNSTDMAMVIDAMDLLYKDGADGFCLVTSDSDFTRLAMRLREEKKYVLGMGLSQTPRALARACNKFIYLNLVLDEGKDNESQTEEMTPIEEIEAAMNTIVNSSSKQRVELGELGSRIAEKYTDFDVRNYGYSKLSTFVDKEIRTLGIHIDGAHRFVQKDYLNQSLAEAEIVSILKQHGGEVENLSVIYNEMKKIHPGFDVKDYGFVRVSSYLRSLKSLKVASNNVSLRNT